MSTGLPELFLVILLVTQHEWLPQLLVVHSKWDTKQWPLSQQRKTHLAQSWMPLNPNSDFLSSPGQRPLMPLQFKQYIYAIIG